MNENNKDRIYTIQSPYVGVLAFSEKGSYLEFSDGNVVPFNVSA